MLKKLLSLLILLSLLPLSAFAEPPAPVPTLFPAPVPITLLTEEEIPPTPDGIRYYLLLCSDRKKSTLSDPGNTDGIMLVAVDTIAQRIMLISFIRDMLLLQPDGSYDRINVITRRWSPEALMTTLNQHFGLRIEKYLLVNWSGVEKIIDALGGVTVTLTNGEAVRLRDKQAYMRDWAVPELSGAGTYTLRGYAAVTYMRIRSDTSIGGERYDYRRTTRARNVVSALADKLRDISLADALKLAVSTIWPCIAATNLTLADMAEAAALVFPLRTVDIEQLRIPVDGSGGEFLCNIGATQQIDIPINRDALQRFIFDNSYTVRSDDDSWD